MLTTNAKASSASNRFRECAEIVLAWAFLRSRQCLTGDIVLACTVMTHNNQFPMLMKTFSCDLGESKVIQQIVARITDEFQSIPLPPALTKEIVIHISDEIDETIIDSVWAMAAKPSSDPELLLIVEERSLSFTCADRSISERIDRVRNDMVHTTTDTISTLHVANAQEIQDTLNRRIELSPLSDRRMEDLIHDFVISDPEILAVDAWDGSLTYKEFDDLTDRLSEKLRQIGVKDGVAVPLLLEFTRWVPVCMYGVMKAGGAFNLLDPMIPIGRMHKYLERMRAPFVITSQLMQARIQLDSKHQMIDVSELLMNDRVTELPCHSTLPSGTAYLTFTSGSTGDPKIVMNHHHQFCCTAMTNGATIGMTRGSRVGRFAPHAFVAAIMEMVYGLSVGACLCIPTEQERLSDIARTMNRMKAEVLVLTPSMAAVVDPTRFETVNTLILGGEMVPPQVATKWARSCKVLHVWTSCESHCTALGLELSPTSHNLRSVGSGITSNPLIVDPLNHCRLLPQGWLGEILLESNALSTGYLGDPAATSQAFLDMPQWSSQRGTRVKYYKSGDLGRISNDGSLELHGRSDPLQVKLRGQRIELGEVEVVCKGAVPTALTVVDLIQPNDHRRPSLACFVVLGGATDEIFIHPLKGSAELRNKTEASARAIENQCRGMLPSYMHPTIIIPLYGVPRTATLKVDRNKLRTWASGWSFAELSSFRYHEKDSSDGSEQPNTVAEKAIVKAVSEVLCKSFDNMSVTDSLRGLGGDSLSAIQIVSHLRKVGLSLSFSDLLNACSLRELAQKAAEPGRPDTIRDDFEAFGMSDSLKGHLKKHITHYPKNVELVLPATDLQERAIRLGTGFEKSFVYHFILKMSRRCNSDRLLRSCQSLVDRYQTLRTVFTIHDHKVYQIVLNHYTLVVDQHRVPIHQYDSIISRITASDITIDQLPVKFWLIRTDVSDTLVLRMSHAQFDGFSLPMMFRSFSLAYDDHEMPKTTAYADYIKAVTLRDGELARDYFRTLLAPVPFPEIQHVRNPKEKYNPHNKVLKRIITIKCGECTPAQLLGASWGFTLSHVLSVGKVVFDMTVSGRQISMPDGGDAISVFGACTNDVPARVDVHDEESVHDLLTHVREQFGETAKHETLGFKSILRDCAPDHWPENARMTSGVQYLGFEQLKDVRLDNSTLDCKIGVVERSVDLETLTICATPIESNLAGSTELSFSFSDQVVGESQAQHYFDLLCATIEIFMENPALKLGQCRGRIEERSDAISGRPKI